jgi:hypothetical protein
MLRACQRACTLQIHVNFLGVRWFAAANSPVEVPPQTSVKPFDPKGPLSQIDAYLDGLPMNDPLVKAIKRIKQFRLAQEKLEYERKSSVGPANSRLPLQSLGCCYALAYSKLQQMSRQRSAYLHLYTNGSRCEFVANMFWTTLPEVLEDRIVYSNQTASTMLSPRSIC